MTEDKVRFGPKRLAEATGLSDSLYPVFYCDERLIVVDMNEAASRRFGKKFSGADMRRYLSVADAENVEALLFSQGKSASSKELYAGAKTVGTRDFSWTLVVPRSFFGERFAEFRLFRSRREMLSSYDSHELMFPVKPKVPSYAVAGDRSGSEALGEALGEVFAYNMLSNLYSAATKDAAPELFDLTQTVRRIVAETVKAFKFNRVKWQISLKGDSPFVFPVMSQRNFINMISLAVTVFSDVSSDGRAQAVIVAGEDAAEIEFASRTVKPEVSFAGDFAFSLVGDMFPGVGSRAALLVFICNLFGVGCFSKMTEDGSLVLTLALSKDGYGENFTVKHRRVFDMKGMREAIALIRMTEGLED